MELTIRGAKLDDSDDGAALVEIIDSYARGAGGQRAPLNPPGANACKTKTRIA